MSGYGDYASKVRHFDRTDDGDVQVVYSDSNHFCILKLCPYADNNPPDNYSDYRRFHVRYYIPKFVYNTKNKKIKKMVFLFNGLNELDHFTLYDQIGQVLCRRGVAAALIPMPDHLNRHPKWRYTNPTKEHINNKPLDDLKERPEGLHERFLQYMEEIEELYKVIRNSDIYEGDLDTYCFYRHVFDPGTRISLLGYSLGGLAALSTFLAKPNRYNSCFLLNSGIQLKDIKLPESMISDDEWQKIVERASEKYKEEEGNIYSKYFGMLYIGNTPALAKKALRPHLRKLLFIFGGADSIIPMESISRLATHGKGLPIFQIPGISHFPAIDREWNNWSLFTVNLIAEFEDNASYKYWSRDDMIETLARLNIKYEFIESPDKWRSSKIKVREDFNSFQGIFHSHRQFFPNFKTLMCEALICQLDSNECKNKDNMMLCVKYKLTISQAREAIIKHLKRIKTDKDGDFEDVLYELGCVKKKRKPSSKRAK